MMSSSSSSTRTVVSRTPTVVSRTPTVVSQTPTVVSRTPNQERIFKIIVIGESGVGKTTLTYRFCEGKFLEFAEATIGVDFRSRTVNIEGEDINLQLWDTAGQERYRNSMVRHYYKNVNAVIIVYDVTKIQSFETLKKWMEECETNSLQDVPKILVGNKCDGIAAVPHNVAQRFADQYNMPLFETSARLDSQCDNVEAIFMTLALKLKNHKQFLPSSISSNSDTVVLSTGGSRRLASSKDTKSSWCC
ncbi:unnamed protein product [Phaedon cochleariae]|uniref:Uncharacterized protein n=1 Tax=Phaedon cochleariae TaxID=80249 RepID=A0A9N9X2Z3_PHACE|nr:unnamed protein product [Phaedon cochleariae]